MTDHARGGWLLRLTCAYCDTRAEFRGFIPQQVLDHVAASPWTLPPRRLTAYQSDAEAVCGPCARTLGGVA